MPPGSGPPTTATLSGPNSGLCSVVSGVFTVTLDQPAGVGGVTVTVTDSVGGDTITATPFTIAAGHQTGTFTITPTTCGHRSISITTDPVLIINGSPIDYNSLCNCPDDAGTNSQSQNWGHVSLTCPPTVNVVVSTTPATVAAIDFYCQTTPLTMTITE